MSAGRELFKLIEGDQGRAFISDAVEVMPDENVFALARGSLKYSRAVCRKLEKWLQENGEL